MKVAIVTGSNKGIGFATVAGLCKEFDGDVFLTARNIALGQESVEKLKSQGLDVKFHQLDIKDEESIVEMRDYMKEKYGGIDVLVNNAGIAFKNAATDPMHVQAKVTIETNYFATKNVCKVLFPILKNGARVVNVSSSLGFLQNIPSPDLKRKFSSDSLTVEELDDLMNQFIKASEDGSWKEKGWPGLSYVVSKVGLSSLTRIQSREMKDKTVLINHNHPWICRH